MMKSAHPPGEDVPTEKYISDESVCDCSEMPPRVWKRLFTLGWVIPGIVGRYRQHDQRQHHRNNVSQRHADHPAHQGRPQVIAQEHQTEDGEGAVPIQHVSARGPWRPDLRYAVQPLPEARPAAGLCVGRQQPGVGVRVPAGRRHQTVAELLRSRCKSEVKKKL